MKRIYTTIGPVRGCCGHRHRTAYAAFKCLNAEIDEHFESDRIVVHSGDDSWLVDENGRRAATITILDLA